MSKTHRLHKENDKDLIEIVKDCNESKIFCACHLGFKNSTIYFYFVPCKEHEWIGVNINEIKNKKLIKKNLKGGKE